MLVGKL